MSKSVPFQAIQFSISTLFKCKYNLIVKTFLFLLFSLVNQFLIQTIQFISALSGSSVPGLSGTGSNGNEVVLRISQNSSITETSPSDCLVSYLGHSLVGGSYPSA